MLMLLLLGPMPHFGQPCFAQQEEGGKSAAQIFEQTLSSHGREPAMAKLREMMADTSGAYVFPGLELVRQLPNRLRKQGKSAEALELVELLEEIFGEESEYWSELSSAYLLSGYGRKAEDALRRSLEMAPDRPEVAWRLSNLDELLEVTRLQLENEGKYAPGENTGIQGPYLGQKPPGRKPKVFAPGILCTMAHEYSISFTPDGKEIYFSRSREGTLVCRWEAAGWTAPEIVRFMAEDYLTEEANVAPDGTRIFFCGRRELRDPREIYQAQRVGNGWGPPEWLFRGMYATATLDGTLYYTGRGEPPDYGAIFSRRQTEGGYAEPELLGGIGINSEYPDAHPFIAPDESFLLFDSYRKPDTGIYVCFREPDGSWGEAIFLCDKLGIPPVGQCALSPDGKYLFFALASDMYWVSADFLADLRPE
jgi:hypothetical protein